MDLQALLQELAAPTQTSAPRSSTSPVQLATAAPTASKTAKFAVYGAHNIVDSSDDEEESLREVPGQVTSRSKMVEVEESSESERGDNTYDSDSETKSLREDPAHTLLPLKATKSGSESENDDRDFESISSTNSLKGRVARHASPEAPPVQYVTANWKARLDAKRALLNELLGKEPPSPREYTLDAYNALDRSVRLELEAAKRSLKQKEAEREGIAVLEENLQKLAQKLDQKRELYLEQKVQYSKLREANLLELNARRELLSHLLEQRSLLEEELQKIENSLLEEQQIEKTQISLAVQTLKEFLQKINAKAEYSYIDLEKYSQAFLVIKESKTNINQKIETQLLRFQQDLNGDASAESSVAHQEAIVKRLQDDNSAEETIREATEFCELLQRIQSNLNRAFDENREPTQIQRLEEISREVTARIESLGEEIESAQKGIDENREYHEHQDRSLTEGLEQLEQEYCNPENGILITLERELEDVRQRYESLRDLQKLLKRIETVLAE